MKRTTAPSAGLPTGTERCFFADALQSDAPTELLVEMPAGTPSRLADRKVVAMRPPRFHRLKNYSSRSARDPGPDVVIVTEECLDISLDDSVSCRIHALTGHDRSTGRVVAVHLGIRPSSGLQLLALFGGHAEACSEGTLGAIRVCRDIPATLVVDNGRDFHDAAFHAAALKMSVTVVHTPIPVGRGPAPSLTRWIGGGHRNISTLRDLRIGVDAWLAYLDHEHRDANEMARA